MEEEKKEDSTETPEWTKEKEPAPEATLKHNHSGGDSVKIKYSDLIGGPGMIYTGAVTAAGASDNLPDGWSSVRDDTGKYTITHNLNNASYNVVAFPTADEWPILRLQTKVANNFSIWSLGADTLDYVSVPFNFIVVLY